MNYLLDTPVISELIKRQPNKQVCAWVDAHHESTLFLSVLTIGELYKGIRKLQDAVRQDALTQWLKGELLTRFSGRILPIEYDVSSAWGTMVGRAAQQGVVLPVIDSLIAATAQVHGLTVITRNIRDMQRCEVAVYDPWQGEIGA